MTVGGTTPVGARGQELPAVAERKELAAEAASGEAATVYDLAFGIGCFSIVPKAVGEGAEIEEFKDPSKWKETIEKGLGALTSVTALQVEINGLSERLTSDLDILTDFPQQYDVDIDLSPETYSYVKFTVTIPRRMHAELFRIIPVELKSERFDVLIVYGFNGPVTFISPVDEPEFAYSSFYVVLVREFLLSEFARVPAASGIALHVVGPSPFHADFGITASSSEDKAVSYDWRETDAGYDAVRFYYGADHYSARQAYQAIVGEFLGSLSMYYYQVRARDRRRRRTRVIDGLTDNLISTHTRRGARGWWRKTFKSAAQARGLLLAAIKTKQLDSEERASLEEHLRTNAADLKIPILREMCLKEAQFSYADHVSMAQEIASTLEGGRTTQFEVLVVSASTILGASAGAVAALIAG
jgi:hypothetical protein